MIAAFSITGNWPVRQTMASTPLESTARIQIKDMHILVAFPSVFAAEAITAKESPI